MAKFKDFGTPAFSSDLVEEVKFKLLDEEFSCRSSLPGKIMLDFAARTADENSSAANAAVVFDFFKAAMPKSDYERFDALISDPDRSVQIETIMDIVSWLMEVYGERPTRRSEDSSTGE
jgi:hypothetical protein